MCQTEMQKVGDTGDVSLLFFLAGANFWAIFGPCWQFWVIFGPFWAILCRFGLFWVIFGPFFGANIFGQKCISAILITFCISGPPGH